ncbi:MAG: MarR family transcriptional regulator [Brevinematales bacterium]|jgi:DNA-binding MarR family transcriptional regulator
MDELESSGEMTIKQLSISLELDQSTLSRTADELFKSGLVERSEKQKDRRYTNLRLTEQGRKISGSINSIWNNVYIDIFKFIPGDKHSSVIESFKLFAAALRKNHERRV